MVRLGRSAGRARTIVGRSAPQAPPRNCRPASMVRLTPEAVVGTADIVPLVGRLEPTRLGHVLFAGLFVEGNPQARLVGNGDVPLVDDGPVYSVPPGLAG